MFITKLFLPMSMPGLAAVGLGVASVAQGTYNLVEIVAIVLGLGVVAVAGIFTIRSNVAKIWREQAEGEKARNIDLAAQMAEMLKINAAEKAKAKIEEAEVQAELLKTRNDLAEAIVRTDLTSVLKQMADEHAEVIAALLQINVNLSNGRVHADADEALHPAT